VSPVIIAPWIIADIINLLLQTPWIDIWWLP